MNADALIGSLERFGLALPAVVSGVSLEDARWKPDDHAWSILEVVSHLADEEVEDFRMRLQLTLENPHQSWPPIDPVGWATHRRYNSGELGAAVQRFAFERRSSIQWLRTLPEGTDWSTTHHHPKIGPLRAGDLLTSWAAHDALHLRQISKRLHQLAHARWRIILSEICWRMDGLMHDSTSGY